MIFIFYALTGMFLGSCFKYAAGVLEAITIFPFRISSDDFKQRFQANPYPLVFMVGLKNSIISIANAFMIYELTTYFMESYDVNYWLFFITALVWSIHIVTINHNFPFSTFIGSTGTLLLLWYGIGYEYIVLVAGSIVVSALLLNKSVIYSFIED